MKHKSLASRIVVACVSLSLFAVGAGLWTLWSHAWLSVTLAQVPTRHLPLVLEASALERNLLNARINFIYYVTIHKQGTLPEGRQRFEAARRNLNNLMGLRESQEPAVRTRIAQLVRSFADYETALGQVLAAADDTTPGAAERLPPVIAAWAKIGNGLVGSAGEFSAEGLRATQDLANDGIDALRRFDLQVRWGLAIALLAGISLAWFSARSISQRLKTDVGAVRQAARSIDEAAQALAQSSQTLAGVAVQASDSASEAASAASGVSSLAGQNSEIAARATAVVLESQAQAASAGEFATRLRTEFEGLMTASRQVAQVIRVVQEIAFQTNMLALNAAVEAARAGDAGAGFSVVAEEVRNLAGRCSEAAGKTEELVNASVHAASAGQVTVGGLADAVSATAQRSAEVSKLVLSVSEGSERQKQNIHAINEATQRIRQGSETSASTAESCAASSEEIAAEIRSLLDQMQDLAVLAGV